MHVIMLTIVQSTIFLMSHMSLMCHMSYDIRAKSSSIHRNNDCTQEYIQNTK